LKSSCLSLHKVEEGMEMRFPPGDTAPIAALDVEAAFQLTLPLLKLPRRFRGACSLAVELHRTLFKGVPRLKIPRRR